MIDWTNSKEVIEISERLHNTSKMYYVARKKSAEARSNFNIILASRLEKLREVKKNLGYETAQIMLLESKEQKIIDLYREMVKQEANYKGLEKIIESLNSQIILAMSLAKNQTKNI